MIDKALVTLCCSAMRRNREEMLSALSDGADLSPFLPSDKAVRWFYLILLLILRRIQRNENQRLSRLFQRSVAMPAYHQMPVHTLLNSISLLNRLTYRLCESLHRDHRLSFEDLHGLAYRLNTEIDQVRSVLIEAYVNAQMRQLKEQEQAVHSIISGSADAIITLDQDYVIRSWNQAAAVIYGYTQEEILGKPIMVLIPEDLQDELEDIRALLQTRGVIQNYETIRQTRDGRRINVAFTATRLRDADGRPNGFISVIVRDITERKELAQRLERKMQGLFIINEIGRALSRTTALDDILYILLVGVTAGQALKFNRAFLFLLNQDRTHLEGRMAIGPSSAEEAGRIWTDLTSKNLTLNDILRSYRAKTHEQDTHVNRVVRQTSIPSTDTSHVLVQSLITQKSFCIEDAARHEGVPAAFLELFGARSFAVVPLYSQEQPLGVLVADNLITGKPILDEDMELLEIFARQASANIENSFLYDALAAKVRALEEANVNLKLYQEKLLHAERLSAMGEIAATVAHELRNPLTCMGGYARMLRSRIPPDSPHQEALDTIINEGIRLENIVTELLDLARPMQIETEPHSINHLIRECRQMIDKELHNRRIRMEEYLQPDLPHVPLAIHPMKQVILNLFNNALAAVNRQGRITVRTASVNASYLEISVSDTGSGIPEEHLHRIFEPFFTTKPGGSGLGLTVAERIVHDHGGTIDVTSRAGEGATFTIRLPLYHHGADAGGRSL
jgi:PAS domain S-box-containing protein